MAIGLMVMTCIAIVFVVVSLRLHYQLLNERDNASGYQSGYEASQDTLSDTIKRFESLQTKHAEDRKLLGQVCVERTQLNARNAKLIDDLQALMSRQVRFEENVVSERNQLTTHNAALLDQLAEVREAWKRDQDVMNIANDVGELNFNQKAAAEAKVAELQAKVSQLLDELAVVESDLQECQQRNITLARLCDNYNP